MPDLIWIIIWILLGLTAGYALGFITAYFLQRAKLLPRIESLKSEALRWQEAFAETKERLNLADRKAESLTEQMKNLEKQHLGELAEKQTRIRVLEEQLAHLRAQKEEENRRWQEKMDEVRKMAAENEKLLREKFENLANRLLEETGKKLSDQQAGRLREIIDPFKDQLREFKEKVEKTDKEQYGRIRELSEQLKQLRELNRQMAEEALNLTKALKGDSKVMGDFGEMSLKRVLEMSGLEEGREYFIQPSYKTDKEGRRALRPDVVVLMPGNKVLIIDSKVSLKHYSAYVNATTDEERAYYLKLHVESMERHIRELASRGYHRIAELEGRTPEMVLMYIPLEPALALALKAKPDLYDRALSQQVVMVTPSTLLATLKVVDSLWKTERQQQNTREILERASKLYDKFVGFTESLLQLGHKLDQAKESYHQAMVRLSTGRDNLIRQVEKMRLLGVPAKKRIHPKLVDRSMEDDDRPSLSE
ncbi:MAG: DNA recombination protein RmuC [Chlorobi bacterium]|nr:DNA recombination protein RmuC [Chlorobiota bacterium]